MWSRCSDCGGISTTNLGSTFLYTKYLSWMGVKSGSVGGVGGVGGLVCRRGDNSGGMIGEDPNSKTDTSDSYSDSDSDDDDPNNDPNNTGDSDSDSDSEESDPNNPS